MKLLWVALAILFNCGLGMFLFMLVAFAGGGYANGGEKRYLIKFFDMALLGLPALCAIAVVMLIVAYFAGWGPGHYWWAALPLPFAIVFVVWMFWAI